MRWSDVKPSDGQPLSDDIERVQKLFVDRPCNFSDAPLIECVSRKLNPR